MTVKALCLYTEELWIQTRNTAVFRLIKEIRIQSESLIQSTFFSWILVVMIIIMTVFIL